MEKMILEIDKDKFIDHVKRICRGNIRKPCKICLLCPFKKYVLEAVGNTYFKVVTQDLKSVGLFNAPQIDYKIGEWVYPLEPLSNHSRKGGGLWVIKRRGDAFRMKKYLEKNHGIIAKIFICFIGKIVLETSYRAKTDKVMLFEELK
jgi:hypothetical protein